MLKFFSPALALLLFVVGTVGCGAPPVQLCDAPPTYTVQPQEHTFVAFGDCQQAPLFDWILRGGPKERARIRAHIRELHPDLFLLAGDAVAEGWCTGYWKQFRGEYREFQIWPTLGNHDLHGSNNRCLRNWFDSFPNLEHSRWYELRYDAIAFLMLDSNYHAMTQAQWKSQMAWMRERLDAADQDASVRCVVLVTHHPPISASIPGGNGRIKKEMYDTAALHAKFKLFISGHHHDYQHLEDGPRQALVAGGGGAPTFYLRLGRLPNGVRLVKAKATQHLLYGRVTENHVRIEMHELHCNGTWTVSDVTELEF